MSKLGSEFSSVQSPLIQYACDIGWEFIDRYEVERLKEGKNNLILREVFSRQIGQLNSTFMDSQNLKELIRKLEILPANIEGNLLAWEYLKGKKSIYVQHEKRDRDVALISDNSKENVYQVTDECVFSNGKFTNRYDAVFFINGIPLFFVEAKASHKIGGMNEALDQIKRYHREVPEALSLLQIYSLTHIIQFLYSATWNYSVKTMFNWKLETGVAEYEKLVKDFFHPERLIKVLKEYILFTRKDDELSKIILRPHQMRAIVKIEKRAEQKKKTRGLIWHTQGSGKTYTMIVAAKQLMENPLLENPTIIMLVDRNELETQLFGNLSSVGFGNVEVASSKRALRFLLRSDHRGLIVTMIHKFEGMPENINLRQNIFVLVDEAHRTTGGDLGNYLMGALPKATYIGFTGTPIDQSTHGKGTFVTFGKDDPPFGYLDKYGIAESIEDGTTVKLHYALAGNELQPNKELLETEFFSLKEAEGVSDIVVLNKVLDKAVNLKNMLKNKERVEKVAKYVVNHYKEYVEPLGYKAFLVGVDREACVMYKKELDKMLPKEYSEVVFSPAHNDPEHIKEFHISKDKEKKVRKSFIKSEQLPKILIVTEKLLTGYDAPVLYCMYLDKPMRDHVLLQAIARVNRPFEDNEGIKKPCGFILDFVGIFDKLEKALSFDSKDITDVVKDVEVLKGVFVDKFKPAAEKYLVIIKGLKGDKAVEAILMYFMDEEIRMQFYKDYSEISDMYEIISPDAFMRPYIDDYDTLCRIYRICREAFNETILIDKDFARKTAKLVQEHTKTTTLKDELEVYEINEDTVKKLEEKHESDIEKVFNLLKGIEKVIKEQGSDNPFLISIGERAENVSLMFKQRQLDTQETLAKLKDILNDINSARKERQARNMNKDVFSIYWLLKKQNVKSAEDIANAMSDAFDSNPYWKESDDQKAKVSTAFYQVLLKSGVTAKNTVPIVSAILKLLKDSSR